MEERVLLQAKRRLITSSSEHALKLWTQHRSLMQTLFRSLQPEDQTSLLTKVRRHHEDTSALRSPIKKLQLTKFYQWISQEHLHHTFQNQRSLAQNFSIYFTVIGVVLLIVTQPVIFFFMTNPLLHIILLGNVVPTFYPTSGQLSHTYAYDYISGQTTLQVSIQLVKKIALIVGGLNLSTFLVTFFFFLLFNFQRILTRCLTSDNTNKEKIKGWIDQASGNSDLGEGQGNIQIINQNELINMNQGRRQAIEAFLPNQQRN